MRSLVLLLCVGAAIGCGARTRLVVGTDAGSDRDAASRGGSGDADVGTADASDGASNDGESDAGITSSSCARGTWDDDRDATTPCIPWLDCAPGEHVASEGSPTSDRTCAACEEGTFSTSIDAALCLPWTPCGDGDVESVPGTTTTDRACTATSWTRQFGTGANDYAESVAIDDRGDVYVAGYVGRALPGQTHVGQADAFVRKYSPAGTELWTRQLGTTQYDTASTVVVDANENVFLVGSVQVALAGQTSAGESDAFVRKYAPDGTELWTRQFGTSDVDEARTAIVDSEGNLYVAGLTYGTFDAQTNAGAADVFVRKYAADGSALWTRELGTSDRELVGSLSIGQDGVLFVVAATAVRGTDALVRAFAPDGTELWTRRFETGFGENLCWAAVDAAGNFHFLGATHESLAGQPFAGGFDVAWRSYGPDGAALRTWQFGTEADDLPTAGLLDGEGNLYLAGRTGGAFPGQTHIGAADALVGERYGDGSDSWTHQFGTVAADEARSVVVDARGNVYVAGITLGRLPGQTRSGIVDAFVMRIVR